MPYRCPDCNKFVSVDLDEPDLDVTGEGDDLSATVILWLNCSECGNELATAEEDVELEEENEDGSTSPEHPDTCDGEIEIVEESAEGTDEFIKKKRYCGANVVVELECKTCKWKKRLTGKVEVASSDFDQMY